MRRYLHVLKAAGTYALLLPVPGLVAHYNFGIRHQHGTTVHNPTGGSQVTHETTQGSETATTPSGNKTGRSSGGNILSSSRRTRTELQGDQGNQGGSDPSTATRSTRTKPTPNQNNQGNQGNQGNRQERPDAYEIAEKLAEESNIGNQYGQRDRFIEREAEKIAKAQRQDRINQEVRERARARDDEEFLQKLDRAVQERYLPSGSAFEANEEWGRVYDHLWQERGLPVDSDASGRQLQASNADLVNEVINQVLALQDRYGNNPEVLAAQLKILAGTGKYDGVVATTEGGGAINLRDYIEGNAQRHESRANLLTTARKLNIPTEGRADQEIVDHINQVDRANAVGAANQVGVSTVGKSAREIWDEVQETQGKRVADAFNFLESRGGYDTDDMTDQEALDAHRREVGGQGLGSVSHEQMELAYLQAFRAGDVGELARLRDSGLGDSIILETADGQKMSYTEFLSQETNRLVDFQRGGFEIDSDHDAQQIINARNDWARAVNDLEDRGLIDDDTTDADIQGILAAQGRVAERRQQDVENFYADLLEKDGRNTDDWDRQRIIREGEELVTAQQRNALRQNVNLLADKDIFTDDLEDAQVLARGEQESKNDLVRYLRRSGVDETFLATASPEDLQRAAGFQARVDELALDRFLGVSGVDRNFIETASLEDKQRAADFHIKSNEINLGNTAVSMGLSRDATIEEVNAEIRRQLVDYLGDTVAPDFARTASIEQLHEAALEQQQKADEATALNLGDTAVSLGLPRDATEEQVDAAIRQQFLEYLGDDVDPTFVQAASTEDLGRAAEFKYQQELVDGGLIKAFPVGPGQTVSLNMMELSTSDPEYQQAMAYAAGKVSDLEQGGISPDLVNANRDLAALDEFTKESQDLQDNMALDQEYLRASTEKHTFQTDYGLVTLSAKEISTPEGEKKYHDTILHAQFMQDGGEQQRNLETVFSLWQHPRELSQKRRLAAAAAVTLATLPFTPLATSVVAGTAIRAGAAKSLLPGVLGAGISTGFATGRPVGDEGWFEFTRDDLGRIPGAATEGFLFGTATGGVGNLAFRGIQASDRLSPLLKNWAGRQTVNVGSGVGTEGAIYLLPDEFGRVRLTGGELGELAVSAALDPAVDPVLSGLQTSWDLGFSVVAKRPYGPSVTVDRPIRFSSEMFASSKPEAQRVQEAQEYLADWLKDLQANQPAHYNAIMETTGGRPPTLADFRLDRAIARNVDVVAMLQARKALSRGESYTIPETGVELYVNPTPFMAQRPGRATHAAPDIRWALEGGELQPLAGKGPANLGMFAFPEGAISDVFARPYDTRYSTTDPGAMAGLVEIDADAGIMVPKVSM